MLRRFVGFAVKGIVGGFIGYAIGSIYGNVAERCKTGVGIITLWIMSIITTMVVCLYAAIGLCKLEVRLFGER